jgi:hypothetical protein
MKIKIPTKKIIHIPILENEVFIRIGGKTSDFLKEFKKLAKDDDIEDADQVNSEMAGWCIHAKNKGIVGIWLEKYRPSIFVHEAVHATAFLLKWAGIKADLVNDELIAYLTEYIVENFRVR